MVGEDQTNKPDLTASPDQASEPEAPQKDAPLPAFIYGRDGHDGSGRGGPNSRDRQNFNARIADMDRKTLLGLVTGAGMLGLVLFFAGMLVGAGLFMDSNDASPSASQEKAPVEMLATAPEEPVAMTEPMPQADEPKPETDISDTSTDPVGDLIAQRSAALGDKADEAAEDAAAETADEATEGASEMASTDGNADKPAISAPEIRDTSGAAPAPDAPAVDAEPSEVAEATEAPEADEPKAAEPAKTETVAKSVEAPKPSAAETGTDSASSADTPFSVQVGAFKVHENASQRAEELRKKGLQVAVVIRGPEDETAWYYVRIGKYATLEQARDGAAKIKKDHALDGFTVRAEPNDREVN